MALNLYGDSLLVAQFREFYREVIRLKRLVKTGVWTPVAVAATPGAEGAEGNESINAVWQRLLTLLERQELAAGRISGDYMMEFYKEAQFLMAALADDIFLHIDWPGREVWHEHLLEAKLFNTHSAGDAFFEKLNNLLQARDPINAELAKIYLMCLSLGFLGKYRDATDFSPIDDYRNRLFDFLKQSEGEAGQQPFRLFTQAYGHMLTQGKEKRLPNPRRWIIALTVLVLTLFGFSQLLWADLTSEMRTLLHQILVIR
jgi:type VI secretion system protein ImpK